MIEGVPVEVCYFQFSMAFDLVTPRLLLMNLRAFGLNGKSQI